MDNIQPNLSGLQTIKFVDDTTEYEYGSLTGDRARSFAAVADLVKLLADSDAPTTITVPIPFRPDQLRLFLYFLENIPLGNLHPGERPYIDYIKPFDEYLKRQVFGFFGIDLPNQMALFRLTRIHPIVERVQQRIHEQPSIENEIDSYVRQIKANIRKNEEHHWSDPEGATRHLLRLEQEKLQRAAAQHDQYVDNLAHKPVHQQPTAKQQANLMDHIHKTEERIRAFTRRIERLERARRAKEERQAAREAERWRRRRYSSNSNYWGPFRNDGYNEWLEAKQEEYLNTVLPERYALRNDFLHRRMEKIGKVPADVYPLNWEWENNALLERTVRNRLRNTRNNRPPPLHAYEGPLNTATAAQKSAIERKVKYRASVEAYYLAKIQRNYNNTLRRMPEANRKGRSPMTAKNRSALNTKIMLMESTLNMNRPNAQWGNLA